MKTKNILLSSFFALSITCGFAATSCCNKVTNEDEWRINNNQADADFKNIKNGDLTNDQVLFEESLNKNYVVNKNRKVILFGLDGIKYNDINNFGVVKNAADNNILFNKKYDIRGWESITGWRNVFYGNLWGTGKTIFENINQMSNKKLQSSVTTNWEKFDYLDGSSLKKDEKKFLKNKLN